MGNSFVLFDVSIVICHGQFHCGNDVCWPGRGGSAEMAAFSRKGSSWQDGWAAVLSMMQSE